jgi:hypothetical protein
LENLKGRYHLEDQGIDGDNIRIDLKENSEWVWTGFMWLRIGASAGLL